MTLVFADRVKESTTSTGTGPLTLGGAESGFRAFSSVCVDGDTAYYCVTDGTSWEVGLGTYAAGVLSRTSVLSSSNGGALVALNPGPKDVFLTVPATLVNSHSDAIEALQAAEPQFGVGAPVTPGTTPGQVYYDTDTGNLPYYWDGAAWALDVSYAYAGSIDAAFGAFQSKVAPLVAGGDPITGGQPTDGSHFYYFDNSTTPYTEWVFDQGVGNWEQVGGGTGAAFVGPHWFPGL